MYILMQVTNCRLEIVLEDMVVFVSSFHQDTAQITNIGKKECLHGGKQITMTHFFFIYA